MQKTIMEQVFEEMFKSLANNPDFQESTLIALRALQDDNGFTKPTAVTEALLVDEVVSQ